MRADANAMEFLDGCVVGDARWEGRVLFMALWTSGLSIVVGRGSRTLGCYASLRHPATMEEFTPQ